MLQLQAPGRNTKRQPIESMPYLEHLLQQKRPLVHHVDACTKAMSMATGLLHAGAHKRKSALPPCLRSTYRAHACVHAIAADP